jgi:hypothetical protein
MKQRSTFTFAAMALAMLMLQACGGSSISSGNGEAGFDPASSEVRGLHYLSHLERLENVMQVPTNSDAYDLLDQYQSLLEKKELNSSTIGALYQIYAAACADMPEEVLASDTRLGDVFLTITGKNVEVGQLEGEILQIFADDGESEVFVANCLAAATSLYGITYL